MCVWVRVADPGVCWRVSCEVSSAVFMEAVRILSGTGCKNHLLSGAGSKDHLLVRRRKQESSSCPAPEVRIIFFSGARRKYFFFSGASTRIRSFYEWTSQASLGAERKDLCSKFLLVSMPKTG